VTAIGFIGLGAMGAPMAQRLVNAGHQLTVWNRTRSRCEPLAASGARIAATPADASRAGEIVITMISDSTALRAVTGGAEGALAGLRPRSVLVDMSTVGPDAILDLAQQVPSGVGLLDAPVLGSVAEARAGSLRIFVGGEEALVSEVRTVLEVLGGPVHVGPLGHGAAAKLVANSTLFGALCILGEAIALGEGLGLSRDAVFEVLAATPVAAQAERRRPAIDDASYPPRFTLALARKDADIILTAAAEAALDLRVAAAARSWLVDADEAGWGALDYTAVLAGLLGQAQPPAGAGPALPRT
jgi:3-hydroxyisobutyrate dehydrogenase-like beta-hydroxyacid dehydrogenase